MIIAGSPAARLRCWKKLRTRGEIRAIGLCNRTHRWQRHIIDSGRADVILPSYDYHPIRQSMAPLLDHAHAANVGVVNGSPYQSGLLAGIDLEALAASQEKTPTLSARDKSMRGAVRKT